MRGQSFNEYKTRGRLSYRALKVSACRFDVKRQSAAGGAAIIAGLVIQCSLDQTPIETTR